MRQSPDAKAIAWLDKQPRTSVWTTSVTILEVRFWTSDYGGRETKGFVAGDLLKPSSRKWGRRIAPFDDAAAVEAADLMAFRQRMVGRLICVTP